MAVKYFEIFNFKVCYIKLKYIFRNAYLGYKTSLKKKEENIYLKKTLWLLQFLHRTEQDRMDILKCQ